MAKVKRRRQAPKAASASSSSAPNPALVQRLVLFRSRLRLVWSQNREVKRGCRFCLGECLESLREDEQSIMDYRQRFRMWPPSSQARDLLWIFGGGADEPLAPNLDEPPAPYLMEHTSPTPSCEPSPMEATSLSITDDGNPMAERQEYTSASDSADAEQPQPNSRPSSPQGATNAGGTILEAPMESTSSSSSMPPLVSDDDPATTAPAPKRRHQYTCRRRRGQHQPTVPV